MTLDEIISLAQRFVRAEDEANAEWERRQIKRSADAWDALSIYDEADALREEWGSVEVAREVGRVRKLAAT